MSGSSGFVGKNLITLLRRDLIIKAKRPSFSNFPENVDVFIHLAGIAHDLGGKYVYNDYVNSNFHLTKDFYYKFLSSNAKIFIFLSSVKVYSENITNIDEKSERNPSSNYGISKKMAEDFLINEFENCKKLGKRIFILRPCMIHGNENKGNLNLLIKWVNLGMPWIFSKYKNKRSYCSINLIGDIIEELIRNSNIQSNIFNCANKGPISTTKLFKLICESTNTKYRELPIPNCFFKIVVKIFLFFRIHIFSKLLNKITSDFIVDTRKISDFFPLIENKLCEEELKASLK